MTPASIPPDVATSSHLFLFAIVGIVAAVALFFGIRAWIQSHTAQVIGALGKAPGGAAIETELGKLGILPAAAPVSTAANTAATAQNTEALAANTAATAAASLAPPPGSTAGTAMGADHATLIASVVDVINAVKPAPVPGSLDALTQAGGVVPTGSTLSPMQLSMLGPVSAAQLAAMQADHAKSVAIFLADAANPPTPDQWAVGYVNKFFSLFANTPKASWGPFKIAAGDKTLDGTGQDGSRLMQMKWAITLADGTVITGPSLYDFTIPADTTGTLTVELDMTNKEVLARTPAGAAGVYILRKKAAA